MGQERPDLTGARVYVEADDRPVAGGRWHAMPDGEVWYERPSGEVVRAVTPVETLEASPTWKPATSGTSSQP